MCVCVCVCVCVCALTHDTHIFSFILIQNIYILNSIYILFNFQMKETGVLFDVISLYCSVVYAPMRP